MWLYASIRIKQDYLTSDAASCTNVAQEALEDGLQYYICQVWFARVFTILPVMLHADVEHLGHIRQHLHLVLFAANTITIGTIRHTIMIKCTIIMINLISFGNLSSDICLVVVGE